METKTMKTMRDSQGRDIPVKYVQKYDKARDAAARRILARFLKARANLEKLVAECISDLDAVKKEATGTVGGEKGNYSIMSFDGLIAAEIRQSYRVMLDERVIRARELMLEYAKGIAGQVEGSDGAALLEIISGAFEANRSGALPYAKVLGLMRLNINAPKWLEAKKLLTESIRPERGKCYLHCSQRESTQEDFKGILLSLAECWPKETKEV